MIILKIILFFVVLSVTFRLLRFLFYYWLLRKTTRLNRKKEKGKKEGETHVKYVPDEALQSKIQKDDDEYIPYSEV